MKATPEERGEAEERGEEHYEPPPTRRDAAQSVSHHLDSALYNSRHAKAHAEESLRHMESAVSRLAKTPAFGVHVKRVERLTRRGGHR